MMGQAIKIGGSSGNKINGLIEEYVVASGGNVNAGDFVKFVNRGESTEYDITQLSSINKSGDKGISAVLLSPNKVFVAHSGESRYYLYAMICTINNTSIDRGPDILLRSDDYTGYTISAVALSSDKVFIAHAGSGYYGIISGWTLCTIDETAITVENSGSISTSRTGDTISAVALSSDKVFIAHSYDDNYYLYGEVYIIDGVTVSKGSSMQLSTSTHSGHFVSAVALSSDKVFIAHSRYDYYSLYAMICTIDGTTIKTGTDTTIRSSTNSGYYISTALLSPDKVFVTFRNDSESKLYSTVCTVSGSSISVGTSINLNTTSGKTTTVALSSDKVFILNGYGYEVICTIDGTTITLESKISLTLGADSQGVLSSVLLSPDRVFIVYKAGSSSFLNGVIDMTNTVIGRVETSNDTILGVAKTKGTNRQTVKVVVPSFE